MNARLHPAMQPFAVSADRAPAQQVAAETSFDAAIAAIESGAQRVESRTAEEVELARLDADAAYVKFKHSPEYHRQRDEDAAQIERRFSQPWELPR